MEKFYGTVANVVVAFRTTPSYPNNYQTSMRSISIHKVVEIAYEIEGVSGYAFGKDKALYNTRTGRRLKHTINGGSAGWWLAGRFMSHNAIRPLLRKPDTRYCPF